MRPRIFLVTALLLSAGCTPSLFGLLDSDGPDVTGTWDASYVIAGAAGDTASSPPDTAAGSPADYTGSFTLAEADGTLSGTYVTSVGRSGQISGTVSGGTVNLTLAQSQPCPGTFSGQAQLADGGRRMTGSYRGSDCEGPRQVEFRARKR